jgi:chromosome partitioning protein
MLTLAIVSQKGGCGKTTLAVHLAAYARQQGLHPAIVDLDQQASAYKWNARRAEGNELSPKLDATQATADKLEHLKKLGIENGIDLLILDTAPHANREAALAVQSADAVLIPCRPATFDLDAMVSTLVIVRATGKPAAIVLNAARRGKRKVAEAREALESIGATVLQTVVHDWVALEDALVDGRAVHEYDPQGKAAEEVALLYRDVTMMLVTTKQKERTTV